MAEAKDVWQAILNKDDSDETINSMNTIIEKNFGSRVLLSQTVPAQQEYLELTVSDLHDLLNSL